MYCITIYDHHLEMIKNIGYLPVGLGENIKSRDFIKDNTKENISKKNPNYGEYTFHYWLWKNNMDQLPDNWIGFCQYRKFWLSNTKNKINTFSKLKSSILLNIPQEYENYESILGEEFFVNQFRFSKFLKRNLFTMIKRPILFLDKNKRNLRFHFDMMHGEGNLSKAIKLLDISEKKDFESFLDNSVSFNPHNMFICKSKKVLKNYYDSLFPWLERCEKEFGFELSGYGLKRIYGFLAERYMSYWFKKYTNYKLMPILFKDLSDF
tara:strand:+ start:585 stop:1379 length:795 start_codon:yes stop_codon:yes gene_type:complete